MRRLNSSCKRSIAFVVRADLHWLLGNRVKVNRFSPASSRLVATAAHFSRHLRRKLLRRAAKCPAFTYDAVAHGAGRVHAALTPQLGRSPSHFAIVICVAIAFAAARNVRALMLADLLRVFDLCLILIPAAVGYAVVTVIGRGNLDPGQ